MMTFDNMFTGVMASGPDKLKEEQRLAEVEWEAMKVELDAVPREDVNIPSQNPLGNCPAYIHGDFSKTNKGLLTSII